MEKNLASMPLHIRRSSWSNSTVWYAPLLMWLHEKLYFALSFPVMFSWLAVAYWATLANIPFLEDSLPAVRTFSVRLFFALALGILVSHWLALQLHVPRADKEYPVLTDRYTVSTVLWGRGFDGNYLLGLALPAICFGLLLMFFPHIEPKRGDLSHVGTGVSLVVLGLVCIYLDRFPPTFGLNVPSENEFRWALASWQAEQERQMQPRNAPAAPPTAEDYATPVGAKRASLDFAGIFGMKAVKDKLLEPARQVIAERLAGQEAPGNGILLHGEPGNGKTVFAEALAGELGVPFIQMTYGDVSSKWLGEMPRVLGNCFAYAKRNAPCVLFIDEIDSFITSRDAGTNNAEDLKVTNTLLTEIVELRKHKVVLVGATNYLARLDAAAIREGRFDYKVEVTPPDDVARVGLLRQGVDKYARLLAVDDAAMLSVAKRWTGFSVSRLLAVTKVLPSYAKERGIDAIGFEEWMGALREVQGRNGRVPKDTKALTELVLQPDTREAIEMVARRLKDAHRVETLGGTLPTGVLFSGPSGTGKTAAARALAKEAGWAFLSVAGPDLVADRGRLDKLYAEAKDIRPTLVFIDEADQVLRNRQYSATPDVCNKLLVLMDGAEERVKDVVILAATNHPDQIDPALLRAGRFTEKVEFAPPPQSEIPRFVAAWLKAKKVGLSPELGVFEVAGVLQGQTIANIEGALQYAVNRVIAKHDGASSLVLAMDDLEAAARVVLAESNG